MKCSVHDRQVCKTSLVVCSHHQKQKLFDLQQQLHVMAQQRDDAVMKLANTQEDLEQTNHELSNLQMVLEQFQKGVSVSSAEMSMLFLK